ncbi:hypothetical protein DPMN_090711 [Dreissena polymorpha]|uniref:Uncharacterized protein n=1 Tax=Dreissena polymorpha TaxID=45954 RepID=A0A9D4L0P5_DREPO|nr:hypothetical protein DPMN_090711 [Dreissena polymorpha]
MYTHLQWLAGGTYLQPFRSAIKNNKDPKELKSDSTPRMSTKNVHSNTCDMFVPVSTQSILNICSNDFSDN